LNTPQYWLRHASGTLKLRTNSIFSRRAHGIFLYIGMTTLHSLPESHSALGSEPATSARPPDAIKGLASLATNSIFIPYTPVLNFPPHLTAALVEKGVPPQKGGTALLF